eukprot:5368364-Amphidinium_carterae.1
MFSKTLVTTWSVTQFLPALYCIACEVLKSWLAQPRLEGTLVTAEEDNDFAWEARASAFLGEQQRKLKSAVPEKTASWQFLQSLDNML